jgi:hypothetical protein
VFTSGERTLAQATVVTLGCMENLTAEQGFHAMFLFLDQYNREMSGTANVPDVLSDLNPAVDGRSSDPAMWQGWLRAIEAATA